MNVRMDWTRVIRTPHAQTHPDRTRVLATPGLLGTGQIVRVSEFKTYVTSNGCRHTLRHSVIYFGQQKHYKDGF